MYASTVRGERPRMVPMSVELLPSRTQERHSICRFVSIVRLKKGRRGSTTRRPVVPVQRGPKPEEFLAAESDGELEVRPVDGSVVQLFLSIAAVDHVKVPLPAIAGANLDSIDGVGKTDTELS